MSEYKLCKASKCNTAYNTKYNEYNMCNFHEAMYHKQELSANDEAFFNESQL